MHMVQLRFSRQSLVARRPAPGGAGAMRLARMSTSAVSRIAGLLLIWQERARQRQQLQSLNDRMLRDIGLTRADILAEASKPFWRA